MISRTTATILLGCEPKDRFCLTWHLLRSTAIVSNDSSATQYFALLCGSFEQQNSASWDICQSWNYSQSEKSSVYSVKSSLGFWTNFFCFYPKNSASWDSCHSWNDCQSDKEFVAGEVRPRVGAAAIVDVHEAVIRYPELDFWPRLLVVLHNTLVSCCSYHLLFSIKLSPRGSTIGNQITAAAVQHFRIRLLPSRD